MESKTISKAQQCGIRCRSIRMAKGMSQQELALKVNCSAQAISKYEKEGISNIDTIDAISNALGQDITADQFDQEGTIGEVGKEILSLLIDCEGLIDYDILVANLYGMKKDRVSNELFKLERIGAIVREQYRDFVNNERDVVFITAKGTIIYKNMGPFGRKTISEDVITYDEILAEGYNSYQDVIDNDKVTALLTTLDNSGMSFRCDYIKYLLDNHFSPRETQNSLKTTLYSYPEAMEDCLCGVNCYVDVLRRLMQRTNRKEVDGFLSATLIFWEGSPSDNGYRDYTFEATGLEYEEIDAIKSIYGNYDVYNDESEELLAGLNIFGRIEAYKHEKKIDLLEKAAAEKELSELSNLPEREREFTNSLSEEKKYNCDKWFSESEIRNFIEENILPPVTESERRIDDMLHQIWQADESTLSYYYSFPKKWENNGLAQLIRDKVGVPKITTSN